MCPKCEWNNNDLQDIEFDVFNGRDGYSNVDIDIHTQHVSQPPTPSGLSFAHINVKGMEHVPNIFMSFDKYLFLEVINILI